MGGGGEGNFPAPDLSHFGGGLTVPPPRGLLDKVDCSVAEAICSSSAVVVCDQVGQEGGNK